MVPNVSRESVAFIFQVAGSLEGDGDTFLQNIGSHALMHHYIPEDRTPGSERASF
jgi:hypothetical protein